MLHYAQPDRLVLVLWKGMAVLSTRCSSPKTICEVPFVEHIIFKPITFTVDPWR
jgi:hypothetical protein